MIKIASAESNTVSTTTGGTSSEEERRGDTMDEEVVMKEKLSAEAPDNEALLASERGSPAKVQRA